MSVKRKYIQADLQPMHTCRDESKRARLSPSPENHSDLSNYSMSANSGATSTPATSLETRQTITSDENDASDPSSSEPSSSSDDEFMEPEDTEDEDLASYAREPARRITEVGTGPRNQINPERLKQESEKLLMRLREFMPKLMKAHVELKAGTKSMEDVEEGEEHIEMDLGLGVLEEKREDQSGSESDSAAEEDGEEKDTAVMQKLLGAQGKSSRPAIQELEDRGHASPIFGL